MDILPAMVLLDPAARVPDPGRAGRRGLPWLRAQVPRFFDGPLHRRRRALVEAVVHGLSGVPYRTDPTTSLLLGLGLGPALRADVATVAAAYQPHSPTSAEADDAADRLVAACGGRSEEPAARVCVPVQAHAASGALLAARRSGSTTPAVPTTRRVLADGSLVEVDLTTAPPGLGPHRCPGRDLAERLVTEAVAHA